MPFERPVAGLFGGVSVNSGILPSWVERRLETAPHYSDRRGLAQLHSELLGPLSPRSLEEWPLTWQLVNGRAVTNTRDAIALAYVRFQAAPKYRSGRAKSATASADVDLK
jgi:hypothetical protein